MARIVSEALLESEMAALVKVGGYLSEKEAMKHALEVLLVANAPLRLDTAVELYRNGQVTLSRAAEIGGVSLERFKQTLTERSIPIPADATPSEITEGAAQIKKLRNSS